MKKRFLIGWTVGLTAVLVTLGGGQARAGCAYILDSKQLVECRAVNWKTLEVMCSCTYRPSDRAAGCDYRYIGKASSITSSNPATCQDNDICKTLCPSVLR